MISKDNYELVKKAIKIHSNLIGRTYLILYKVNAKQKSKVMETPEAAMFRVGAGSNNGVIGYSDEDKGMIPKTAQQKSVFKIKADANDKIYLIISKPYGNAKYDRIDYKVSPKIFPSIIEELPKDALYEDELFAHVLSNNRRL